MSVCWGGDQCDRVRAPSRGVGSILANSRGARKKASLACTRRWGASRRCHRTPATYIHTPPHTRTHAHTGNQRNTRARAYCNCILWFFATDQQHARSQRKGPQSPLAKENNTCLRLKSTPIAQGLVKDINAKHACGPNSYTNSSRDGMK